jgi:hypothetical protein
MVLLLFPVFMGSLVFLGVFGGDPSWAGKLIAVSISFLWPALMYRWMRRQWLKVFDGSPYLRDAFVGTLSEEGLHFESQYGTWKVPWGMFTKVRRNAELVLLYQSPIMFQLLSRDLFVSQQSWEDAVAFVNQRLT